MKTSIDSPHRPRRRRANADCHRILPSCTLQSTGVAAVIDHCIRGDAAIPHGAGSASRSGSASLRMRPRGCAPWVVGTPGNRHLPGILVVERSTTLNHLLKRTLTAAGLAARSELASYFET